MRRREDRPVVHEHRRTGALGVRDPSSRTKITLIRQVEVRPQIGIVVDQDARRQRPLRNIRPGTLSVCLTTNQFSNENTAPYERDRQQTSSPIFHYFQTLKYVPERHTYQIWNSFQGQALILIIQRIIPPTRSLGHSLRRAMLQPHVTISLQSATPAASPSSIQLRGSGRSRAGRWHPASHHRWGVRRARRRGCTRPPCP